MSDEFAHKTVIDDAVEDLLIALKEADQVFQTSLDATTKRRARTIRTSVDLALQKIAPSGMNAQERYEQVREEISPN